MPGNPHKIRCKRISSKTGIMLLSSLCVFELFELLSVFLFCIFKSVFVFLFVYPLVYFLMCVLYCTVYLFFTISLCFWLSAWAFLWAAECLWTCNEPFA